MGDLCLEGLSKVYRGGSRARGGVRALDRLTTAIPSGLIGLAGPNGAGKTTLMRILATITRPTAGRALIHGVDVVRRPDAVRAMLGYLPQAFDFYPGLRVTEVLAYIAELKGVAARERPARIEQALTQTGLSEFRNRPAGSLSGGMKRRLGIAQALVNQPRLLILDEPTSGLDPAERVRFRSLLSSLAGDRLVLLSTHVAFDIEAAATWLLILSRGRAVFDGPPAQALDRVRGRVWLVTGDEGTAAEVGRRPGVILVGTKRGENGLTIRLIAEGQPERSARPAGPTLEDAYLYLVGGTS